MESTYYIIENHLPSFTWPLLLILFFLSLGLTSWKGKQRNEGMARAVLCSLLITYTAAILFTTLIFRTPAADADGTLLHKAEWMPLWSWYEVIENHSKELLGEILLNVVLFVPVGVFVTLLYKFRPLKMFLIGFLFSAAIELTQLILCRGLFEWDDMLHNGLGSLLGCLLGRILLRVRLLRNRTD